MFGFFKRNTPPTYSVDQLPNGRFGIFENDNLIDGATYSRRRDAIRGATRAGIELTVE